MNMLKLSMITLVVPDYDEAIAFYVGALGFEIVEGATTNLTIRTNLDTLDWNDADDNGEWTEGVDELSNWTTIPGTDTMVDYIVE